MCNPGKFLFSYLYIITIEFQILLNPYLFK